MAGRFPAINTVCRAFGNRLRRCSRIASSRAPRATAAILSAFLPVGCTEEQIGQLADVLKTVIVVPVRWCAVEGSPQAEGKTPGQTVDGERMLDSLRDMNFTSTLAGARILFVAAKSPSGIPVVADPDPDLFEPGDITVGGPFPVEPGDAFVECEQEWGRRYPNQRGIIAVNARVIIGSEGVTGGAAPTVPRSLWVQSPTSGTGQRGDDLCGSPRKLSVSDVSYMLNVVVFDPEMYEQQPYNSSPSFAPDIVLAHELGHSLMLDHGNGLDDNGDGLQVGDPGRRRFDGYCDFRGVGEDASTDWVDCDATGSIMLNRGCRNIQPLQAEQMREVAKLVPGAKFESDAPQSGVIFGEPGLLLHKVQLSRTPEPETFSITYTVPPARSKSEDADYITALDLDGNRETGCRADAPTMPVTRTGIELLMRASVSFVGDNGIVTPTVWSCQEGALIEDSPAGVHGSFTRVHLQDGGAEQGVLFDAVSVELPEAVAELVETRVGVDALANRLDSSGNVVARESVSSVVALDQEPVEICVPEPSVGRPGEEVEVTARNLPVGGSYAILLGDKIVARGAVGDGGATTSTFDVPDDYPNGIASISVRVAGSAIAQGCALGIEE